MINIHKRGRIWWARGSIRGKRVAVSLDTQFQKIAWQRAQEIEQRDCDGLDTRRLRWPKFESEFLAWIEPHIALSTWRHYKYVVAAFGRSLEKQGITYLHEVTAPVVVAYIAERMQQVHPKHGTKPRHGGLLLDLRILRRIFNYAKENRYMRDNPVKQPRLNHTATVTLPFTDDELVLMFADPEVREKPKLRAILAMLLHTGLRISDVAGMKRSCVHFAQGRIDVQTQKTGSLVSLPIHPDLRAALAAYLPTLKSDSESPLLFPTEEDKFDHSFDAKLRRIWKRAGIERAHAHRFRDTFSVKLLARGASLYDVAKLLGNSVRIVEKHYAPYTKELQERGHRLVNEIRFVPDEPAQPAAAIPIQPASEWKN